MNNFLKMQRNLVKYAESEGGAGNNPEEETNSTQQEETISKAQFDKLASEYAKFKRDVKEKERANMTEQQLKEAKAQDTLNELNALKKENAKSKAIGKLNKLQCEGNIIEELASALVDGDVDKAVEGIVGLVTNSTSEINKKLQTALLGSTPRPSTGDNSAKTTTVEDFRKMTIDERINLKATNPDLFATLSNQSKK